MDILIIDNSSITIKENSLYTNPLNGLFVDELIELNNRVFYLQFGLNSTNQFNCYNLNKEGIRPIVLRFYKNKLLRYFIAYYKTLTFIRKVDFVYFYYPSSFKYMCFICRILRKPYGIYIRGMKGVSDKISFNIYRHSYTIFTVSDYFTNMVNSRLSIDKASTIRPMIPYTDADVVYDRDYSTPSDFNLLYLGRIDKDKGLSELIDAIDSIRNEFHNLHLTIVGDGEYLPHLKQMVVEKDLLSIVRIKGPVMDVNEKATYFKGAHIYVLPTYHEGFPRTLYEAMIYGTPIITTFVGGIPALMIDGNNCKRIEPHSSESIVTAMRFAFNNYEEMGKLAKNASMIVAKIVDRSRLSHAQDLNEKLKKLC